MNSGRSLSKQDWKDLFNLPWNKRTVRNGAISNKDLLDALRASRPYGGGLTIRQSDALNYFFRKHNAHFCVAQGWIWVSTDYVTTKS